MLFLSVVHNCFPSVAEEQIHLARKWNSLVFVPVSRTSPSLKDSSTLFNFHMTAAFSLLSSSLP